VNEKPDNAYCFWCGHYDDLKRSEIGERVCLDCFNEPDYMEHVSRVQRERRRVAGRARFQNSGMGVTLA
jgi:hypothetical protein